MLAVGRVLIVKEIFHIIVSQKETGNIALTNDPKVIDTYLGLTRKAQNRGRRSVGHTPAGIGEFAPDS